MIPLPESKFTRNNQRLGEIMSHQLRQEYLNLIRERYKNSCRNKKTSILNEFC